MTTAREKAYADKEQMDSEKLVASALDVERQSQLIKPKKKRGYGYPLAMFAFGMSNILLGQRSARALLPDAICIAQGLFFAGLGQTLAGFFAFVNNDTIGTFMCLIFGSWWYCLAGVNIIPMILLAGPDNNDSQLLYNLNWASFLFLNCGVVASGIPNDYFSLVTMMLVTITGTSFGVHALHPEATWIMRLGGIACTCSGVTATYIATSHFLREVYGYQMLPLGTFSGEEAPPRESLKARDTVAV